MPVKCLYLIQSAVIDITKAQAPDPEPDGQAFDTLPMAETENVRLWVCEQESQESV